MTGTLQPLDNKFAIVDVHGNPTDYFIRWAQQKQIDIGSSITLTDLANYLAAHKLASGQGIALTPDGNLADSPSISVLNGTGLDFDVMHNLKLADTAVAPGTYGDATHVPAIVVDQQGRITGVTLVAISGGGGGGALALLGTATSTGVSGVLTLGSIPNTAKDLIIVLVGRTDNAAAQIANMTVNGSPTADMQRIYAQGGSISADQTLATTLAGFFIAFPGTGYTAGMAGHQEMTIFEYANTNFWKNFYFTGRQTNNVSSGNAFLMHGMGELRTLSAINTITMTLAAGNWVAGSVMRVYGRT